MKVIFLDIDGTLNVIPQGHDKYGGIFHEHFVENLRQIIEKTNAKIVISSHWRMSGLQVMKDMWETRNLPGDVIDVTPNLYSGFNPNGKDFGRGDEIQKWLDTHPDTTGYVIIDDDYFDINDDQLPYLVRTSGNTDHTDCIDLGYGLTKECSEQVINILNHGKKI